MEGQVGNQKEEKLEEGEAGGPKRVMQEGGRGKRGYGKQLLGGEQEWSGGVTTMGGVKSKGG